MNKIANKIIRIIASKYFFWGVLLLFVLQAAWITFSSAYGMPYDEGFHFGVINIFGHQWSPFITNQPLSYDIYANLEHGDATLFHYLMSFPYRLVSLFTNNLAVRVISLRLICIALVAGGIVLFSRLFNKVGIKQIFINIGMLLFILLPIVTFLAATINYDNMLFPATALFLIICVDLLSSKTIQWQQFAWFIVVGCFASLVKYTFLPLFAFSVVYIFIILYRRHGWCVFHKLLVSIKKSSKKKIAGVVILVVLAVGMFSVVYIQNFILYGSPRPDCAKVMSMERCETNSVIRRNNIAEATKDTRQLMQNPEYVSGWFLQMIDWSNMTGGGGDGVSLSIRNPLPIIYVLVFTGVVLGLLSLIYSWKSLKKNASWYYLLSVFVALLLVVFTDNFIIYMRYHAPLAMQPRYLLSLAPIIIVMAVVAVNDIFKKRVYLKVSIFLITLLLLTQGGGLITYILQSKDVWYWQNSKVVEANHIAKKILQPLVKEK